MSRKFGVLAIGILALAGCKPQSSRTDGDGELLAAGIPGAVAATALAAQDSTPIVVRRVWGGPDVDLFGTVSPDGRYLTFVDWSTGNLAVRELATGDVRLLTDDGSHEPYESAEGASVSPDGEWVAYSWYREGAPYELRIVGMDGSGGRVLCHDIDIGVGAWSPDGQQILTVQSDGDGAAALVLVSVADCSARALRRFEGRFSRGIGFSPDGRYIVYDIQAESDSEQRDIFLLDLDSGREVPLVQNPADDYVLGWAPGGEHILFASDRTGTVGAWLQPVADGHMAGDPRLVKADMWRVWPLGFTGDGSFYYGVNMTARAVYVASLDLQTGEVLAPPASVNPTHLAYDADPAWSPDGRYLAYRSRFGARIGVRFSRTAFSIRSVETGETRELEPDLSGFGPPLWWVDGGSLLVNGKDRNERRGVFRIDVQTGHAEPFSALRDVDIGRLIGPSPDGKAVFYYKRVGGERVIAVMDLETGRERVLFTGGVDLRPALSPDGRYLAFVVEENESYRLLVMPAAGGEPQELLRYQSEKPIPNVANVAWSRDGRSVLYPVERKDGTQLWHVSLAGGRPRKLDLAMSNLRNLRVHPDGKRIAFDSGTSGAEVWVMEDFLPTHGTGQPESEGE